MQFGRFSGRSSLLFSRLPALGIRKGIFHSLRMQALVVMMVGVLLPTIIVAGTSFLKPGVNPGGAISVAGCGFCAMALLVILRRFSVYPSTPTVRSILPVLATLYGIFLLLLTFFRLEYSNQILLACFIATLGTRFAIAAINMRGRKMVYWTVPGGQISVIEDLENVSTLRFETPELPPKFKGTFVADLHFDHELVWERFLAEAAISGSPVYHYKQVWEAATGKVQMEHLSENSFGALLPSHVYQKTKGLIDFLFCVLVLPLVIPFFLLIGLAIWFDSKGSIFFRQERMGFRGRPFKVLKFRTMGVIEDGNDREASRTLSDDARITRIGRILRKTRLDELPQIWNILKGEMSWIGPRPEAVSLSAWYEDEIPFYRYRHIVKPGITGWAQINQGHVSSLEEVDDKLQYDFYYIKHLSYWLDILIALRTVRVVLSGFGAK